MKPDNKALHQTKREGAPASRAIVEARFAGEGRCWTGLEVGRRTVAAASRHRRGTSGFTLLELLLVVAIISIISAIAIPGLLRSRVAANEAAAIMDIREAVADRPGNPADTTGTSIRCPSPPGSFSTTKSGYVRGCTAGVFWATPVVQGRTGIRGFGGDGTGRLCFTNDGSIPKMGSACESLK